MFTAAFVWVGFWAARCSSLALTVSHETSISTSSAHFDVSKNYRTVPSFPVASHYSRSRSPPSWPKVGRSRIRRLSPLRKALVSLKLGADDDTEDAITAADELPVSATPRNSVSVSTLGWSNQLRQTMAFIAGLGMTETIYLTYADLTRSTSSLLCLASSSCHSVLQGPYAHLPGSEIPLAALGVVAYATVMTLSLGPTLLKADPVGSNERDQLNQVVVTAVTSSMAVFSLALVAILVFLLHESCLYCFASAGLSFALACMAWRGSNHIAAADTTSSDSLVIDDMKALPASAIGALTSIAAAALLVTSVNGSLLGGTALKTTDATLPNTIQRQAKSSLLASSSSTSTLMAVTNVKSNSETKAQPTTDVLQSPPAITTSSSDAALRLAKDLQSLDATFYGAFWCGHCYEQKQAFGREAMAKIPYVECSKDGVNAQAALCKEKKIPGYPTWEIGGQLYPGEQALEELQAIAEAKKGVIL